MPNDRRLLVRVLPHGTGLPAYQTPGAAGLDLCAAWDVDDEATWPVNVAGIMEVYRTGVAVLYPGCTVSIPTGIAVAIPPGYEGQVRGRSGILFRDGVHVPQTGTIDADYRGEVRVALHNASGRPFTVRRGDRIAQLIIAPVARCEVVAVDALSETERGASGFGSTGVRP